ncbi:hypothetical protein EW026_g5904 [Hermanssonia centrifuga]|uniref:Uncharacterized protein n=1 Tax=Hermanssonia centrifuga TaxID=98765 RepID=A0A4S4KCM8_9APHY|nr:hypothetical protein EW026_g5904 [Hermanssonia centrifuga]
MACSNAVPVNYAKWKTRTSTRAGYNHPTDGSLCTFRLRFALWRS